MELLSSNLLGWLTLLAALTFLVFLVRGLKTVDGGFFVRLFIALSCLCAALVLYPRNIPLRAIRFVASVVVIAAASAIAADIALGIFLRIKRAVSEAKELNTQLPDYLLEICKALEVLAHRRVGALIIIRGKDKLDEYVDSGILFDAQIRSEILIALFSSASPVHDGAVVVLDGRIRRVKVILSIRTGTEVPMGIGTRHRSAIGITEKTDSMALVVSEERGEISVVYRGCLVKIASMKELHRLIKMAIKGKRIVPA